MADLSDDYLNAIIEHATGYDGDGDGTQAMNSGDLQSIARAAIAADRALNAQAAAEPMANPNDPQWMAFMSWAQKRWGSETWRHTSNTCGEWDAWQAGRLAERAAIAAPPQQASPVAPAEPRCVECEGPVQWRCPACQINNFGPAAPAGWRMVPVEPTYRMLRESLIPAAEAARYYARMLAAAPHPAPEPTVSLPAGLVEGDLIGGES